MPQGGGPDGPGGPGGLGGGQVRRSSLRQQIADALRDEVLTGRLSAGRHFTVKEIAETYGVSATPVREALVDLAAQGLLELEQHRGFQVRRFTAADYRSLTPDGARAHPTDEHFLPLFVALGAAPEKTRPERIYDDIEAGVLAMDAYVFN